MKTHATLTISTTCTENMRRHRAFPASGTWAPGQVFPESPVFLHRGPRGAAPSVLTLQTYHHLHAPPRQDQGAGNAMHLESWDVLHSKKFNILKLKTLLCSWLLGGKKIWFRKCKSIIIQPYASATWLPSISSPVEIISVRITTKYTTVLRRPVGFISSEIQVWAQKEEIFITQVLAPRLRGRSPQTNYNIWWTRQK